MSIPVIRARGLVLVVLAAALAGGCRETDVPHRTDAQVMGGDGGSADKPTTPPDANPDQAVDRPITGAPALLIAVDRSVLQTSELGAQAMFAVALNQKPTADVRVPLSSSSPTEGTLSAALLTFTPLNWNAYQTVTVSGVDDAIKDGNRGYTVGSGPTTSSDPRWQGIVGKDVTLINTDDESAGVLVFASDLHTTESGGQAMFSVALSSRPMANVTIPLASMRPSEGTVSVANLVFTNANWNAPQSVTVTGVDDAEADGAQTYQIQVRAAISDDSDYDGFDGPDVTVVNIDNDSAGISVTAPNLLVTTESGGQDSFTIALNTQPAADVVIDLVSQDLSEGTLAPARLTFTPVNWQAPQTVTVTGVEDDIADGNQRYTIAATAVTSADPVYAALPPPVVNAANVDNDSAGITVAAPPSLTVNESGTQATFTVVLTSAPAANVTIPLSSGDSSEGTVSPATLVFTPSNWKAPQTVTVTGVGDSLADGNQPYFILLAAITSGDAAYAGMDPPDVLAVTVDDDTAGITVTPTTGLVTTEAGGQATFTVVLNAQPTGDVSIPMTSSDSSEGLVSPSAAVFTPLNWNAPQTITITGVDDALADGNQVYRAITGIPTSVDPAYAALDPADVSATNGDNDTAGFTVTAAAGLHTTEAGADATFTIVLNSQPIADVVVLLVSSDTTEGTVAPGSITFTPLNWNASRTVTVTGINDDVADGNQPFSILTSATSADNGYALLDPADVVLSNTDNDTPGFAITPPTGLVTTEAGTTATFTIALNSQPTADVTVGITSGDTTEGTVAPASVTFTSTTWSTAQTITVTGVDDLIPDGNQGYTIVTAAAVSADTTGYSGMNPANVAVSNTDNDVAAITVTAGAMLTTTELGAGTATFSIVLTTPPSAIVAVGLTSSDTTEGTVSPASVVFDSSNWNVAQTVTVTGVDDALDDGNQPYTIVTAAAVSVDLDYSGINPANVSLTNTDNDNFGITVTPQTGLVTTEALGTATFTIVLDSQPTADVTIGLSSSNTGEGTVSPASVTFTSANWFTAQTVTVTGVNDFVDDGDVTYSIVTAAASSTDTTGYSGLAVADVAVSNTDNDTIGITVTPTSGLITTEAGGTATFTVVLNTLPAGAVTISVDSSDLTEGTVSTGMLTFTTGDWNMAQTVTITGVDDATPDGDVAYSIILGTATNYGSVNPTDPTVTNREPPPMLVTGLPHSCALKPNGTAYCWGHNANGSVGDGTTTDRPSPTAVTGGLTFSTIAAMHYHNCGLKASNGAPYCWGLNDWGQLGDGTMTNRTAPTLVQGGMTGFTQIVTGGSHACVLDATGHAFCWGLNASGQLGDGSTTTRLVPTAVAGGLTFAKLWLDSDTSCGLTAGGVAYCWGRNVEGEIGDGTTTQRNVPTAVSGGLTFASLGGGSPHTCGLTAGGTLYCWGTNGAGQLGDGTTAQRNAPVAVAGGLIFASVAANNAFGSCGVVGTAGYCWGNNGSGQNGDGTTTNLSSPTAVMGGLSFSYLTRGAEHTCGMTTAGAIYCWGLNANGRLGDGTTTDRPAPTLVTIP